MPCPFLLNPKTMRNKGNRPNKRNIMRQDITLMTLLANESVAESRKLLKKYGKEDAKDHKDLEVKLAELYFATPDKVQLEKELASIHPHKNWILKYYPQIKEESKQEPIIQEALPIKEEKSNADGGCGCTSNFDASSTPNNQRIITTLDYVAIISLVGVIGLTFYVISKQK
jgi:predicted metal-dependent hydrolase